MRILVSSYRIFRRRKLRTCKWRGGKISDCDNFKINLICYFLGSWLFKIGGTLRISIYRIVRVSYKYIIFNTNPCLQNLEKCKLNSHINWLAWQKVSTLRFTATLFYHIALDGSNITSNPTIASNKPIWNHIISMMYGPMLN